MAFNFKALLGFAEKVAPTAVPILAGFNPLAAAVLSGIIQAEKQFGAKKGEEKKQYVIGSVMSMAPVIIPLVEQIVGKDFVDDDKFIQGISKLVDGLVETMNSFNALQKVQNSQ